MLDFIYILKYTSKHVTVSVSAAIQKLCSPYYTVAHFQGKWALGLSPLALKLDKNMQMMTKKKDDFSIESRLSENDTTWRLLFFSEVSHSPHIPKLHVVYCVHPTSWCCDNWQRQFVHITIKQQFSASRTTQGSTYSLSYLAQLLQRLSCIFSASW